MKHTPGPWKVEQKENERFPDCSEFEIWNQNTHITTVHEHVDNILIDLANARLISAAPELLEALKIVAVHLRVNGKTPGEVKLKDFVEDTIAKATGDTSTTSGAE